MTNYTLGETYRKAHIDTSSEIVPQNTAFASYPDEEHIYEPIAGLISYQQVTNAIESGLITNLDKAVISLVATFGSAACTTKSIFELLTMMNIPVNKNTLESSLKRLHRYHLIDFSRFRSLDGKQSNTRIITLAVYGSRLANDLGVVHRFDHNRQRRESAKPYSIKSRIETTQLICNWLKNLEIDSFSVRPVIVIDANIGAIIRPAATININGEKLYFEVPRKHEDWLEDLVGKLHRYELVFKGNPDIEIVINGESPEMNLEIFNRLKSEQLKLQIMYTDDLKMFGTMFNTCLYTFDAYDNMITYKFVS